MTDLLPTIPKRVQLHLPPWGFNTLHCIYYLGLWTPVVMHGPIRLMDVVISFWKQSHVLFLFITRFKSVPADCRSLTFTPSMPSMADLFWGVGGISTCQIYCKTYGVLLVYGILFPVVWILHEWCHAVSIFLQASNCWMKYHKIIRLAISYLSIRNAIAIMNDLLTFHMALPQTWTLWF